MEPDNWGGPRRGAGRPAKPKLTRADCDEVLELLDALDWHAKQRLIGDAPELLERSSRARVRIVELKNVLQKKAS